MASLLPIQGVIFDLGDVLFQWSPHTNTSVSPQTLKNILQSTNWHDYERGTISQAQCYDKIAQEFVLEVSHIAEAFSQARESLQQDEQLVAFIKDLKHKYWLKVYAMSNVGREDFEALVEKMDWSLFDGVFASGVAGMRKPDPQFFQHVLREIDIESEKLVFLDDKQENVLAAEALGIKGIVFDGSAVPTLEKMLDNPVAKGYEYLRRNAKKHVSVTSTGVEIDDNFARLLILEATQDTNVVDISLDTENTWNYFAGEATLVPGGYFPDDLDTTSLALTVLRPDITPSVAAILDRMSQCRNFDGTFMTYFDSEKPRIDAVVSSNVLACFYHFGRGRQFDETVRLICDVLERRIYLEGTRYYPSPDCCLGFFTRLLQYSGSETYLHDTLGPLLKEGLKERVGKDGSVLDLAMRITACDRMGIECEQDRRALVESQRPDGGWDLGWMYRYGSTGIRIGNRGVSTALAMRAITGFSKGLELNKGMVAV
ncbi:HAD-like protein [Corynespora cassiicola Philippines]|uniref:HAD-like protein n=1 Tax=Corynespora cassiicola Philippines TaxID=1448308 RepID=A0A2T2N439_CORCC|nr:HAD-like protein [Corynespora cassiicola Philippines]